MNLPEIIAKIDKTATRIGRPTTFFLGKTQDALALDPLSAYSKVLVPFFASHKFARQMMLTKSTSVRHLLDLEHCGHTTLAWSLNPREIVEQYEKNTPSLEARLCAIERCAKKGYPIKISVEPVIPVDG